MAGRGSEYIDEFLEESVIRIGFAHDASLVVDQGPQKIKEIIRAENPLARERQIGPWATQLRKFLYEMQKDDRVLVYEFGTRLYHVGQVSSGVTYEEGREQLPYTRKVKWVGTVSRDQLSTGARNSLGAILTLFSVNEQTRKEVENALAGKSIPEETQEENEEITEYGDAVISQAKEYLKDKILELSWDEMQELVAGLLRAMGYKTSISNSGPDRGKDIVASPDGFGLQEPRIVVEVKHRKGAMGAPEVRAFIGGVRKSKGLYVSTGGFSREAHYEAERSDSTVTLVDIEELARMIVRYYDNFDNEARALLPLKKIYWPV